MCKFSPKDGMIPAITVGQPCDYADGGGHRIVTQQFPKRFGLYLTRLTNKYNHPLVDALDEPHHYVALYV